MLIQITGIDAAFANMGFARMRFDTKAPRETLELVELRLITTEGQHKKEVRKSSDDLRRARELVRAVSSYCTGSLIAAVEVPTGSQSARSAWSLGIAVGVIASCPTTLVEVSPLEVKMASAGKKTASKAEIIEWATTRHPHSGWLKHKGKLTQANEHLADAVASIYAALETPVLHALCGTYAEPLHREPTRRIQLL